MVGFSPPFPNRRGSLVEQYPVQNLASCPGHAAPRGRALASYSQEGK